MKKSRDQNEFIDGASEWSPHLSRRRFLQLSAATLAFAGVSGCTRPPRDPIFPYVDQPENIIPGKPIYFSSARVLGGLAQGILIETHLGRPTKIEGNPDHPANRGRASAWQQASILGLYDPERGKEVHFNQRTSSWAAFETAWEKLSIEFLTSQGEGLAILTEPSSSVTLQQQRSDLQKKFPRLRWITYAPLARATSVLAAHEVFGKSVAPVYDFKKAEVVVSFDADFLASPQYPVSYANDFINRRRLYDQGHTINRLFVAECTPSLTGLKAQYQVSLSSTELENLVVTLGQHLIKKQNLSPSDPFLASLVPQIEKNQGRCVFIAGPQQSHKVHAVCHFLNAHYGREAVKYIADPLDGQESQSGLQNLARDISNGQIKALFIVDANPSYTAPAETNWSELLKKVPHTFKLSLYEDETAQDCQWYLPSSDDFESWSDAKSFDGRDGIIQPAIQPLYDSKSWHELLFFLTTGEKKSSYQIVQSHWQKVFGQHFEKRWKSSLKKGLVDGGVAGLDVSARPITSLLTTSGLPIKKTSEKMEVVFRPHHSMYDGRFANNAWLQELPDPLTKVTWGNTAAVSPEWAQEKQVVNGQILEIKIGPNSIKAPAWILKGSPKNSITLTFGFGRQNAGKISHGVGYNAFKIWTFENPDFAEAEIVVTQEHEILACAQTHQKMEGRNLIRTSREIEKPKAPLSLYPANPDSFIIDSTQEAAWGMAIDLDSCIGCAACVVACQSENNIPVVGKDGVLAGREMHWIRVDRYEDSGFQPVPCMHCEKAPCEPVCPVAATVHGNGGLNQMIYNRCVGTRYCSSNCPYKVRRFNFLTYNKPRESEKLQKNPDVSIRTRGVMEKCTYCVQRINQKSIEAKVQNRKVRDGEIQTACQQTCPTEAITFGNINDLSSQVRQLKDGPRNYSLLEELGTRPRTTYLAVLSSEKATGHD
jgi:Fe-S-cluster-containing dehydrogenase component